MEELLTRKEVMKIFKVTYRTVVNWEKQGILKPWKIEKVGNSARVRYLKSDIENVIKKYRQGGEEE